MGHQERVSRIKQALIKGAPFSFHYHKGPAHTLGRSSSRKALDISSLHHILVVDPETKTAHVEAARFVELTYTHFVEKERALFHLQYRSQVPDFLEAVIYPEGESIVIEGRKAAKSSYPLVSLRSPGALWYFEHAQKSGPEKMALQEYLFHLSK